MTWPALVAIALAAQAVPAPDADEAFAGLPDVTFTYYDVDGADAAAIRAAMNVARPTDGNDGHRVDALTHWSMRWRWTGDRHGGCDLAAASVTVRAEVTLPRLAHPEAAAPDLLARWSRYMAALRIHEAGHVRYAYDHRDDVLAAIRGATCATASDDAKAALQAIKAHDIAYDRDTGHGRTQGAVFP